MRPAFSRTLRGSPSRFGSWPEGWGAQTLEFVQAQLKRIGAEVVPLYATLPGHDQVLAPGAFDVTLFA